MGQTELGQKTIEDCMLDLKLSQSLEGDLGCSIRSQYLLDLESPLFSFHTDFKLYK